MFEPTELPIDMLRVILIAVQGPKLRTAELRGKVTFKNE